MRKPRRDCLNCGHHKSAHEYKPHPEGISLPPQNCVVPGCVCRAFVRPEPNQRRRKIPDDSCGYQLSADYNHGGYLPCGECAACERDAVSLARLRAFPVLG